MGLVAHDLSGITTAVLGLLAKALLKNSNELDASGSFLLLLRVVSVDVSESCLVRCLVMVFGSSSISSREGIRSNSGGPGSTGIESMLDVVIFLVRNMLLSGPTRSLSSRSAVVVVSE